MQRDEFLSEVEDRAELDDRQRAADATEAVLETLGERLLDGEADDVAAQLPDEVADPLARADADEAFDFEEFTGRVDERLDADASPKRTSQAVASAVVDATTRGELQDLLSELPKGEGYGELLALADESAR